jgi:hypothetical protein
MKIENVSDIRELSEAEIGSVAGGVRTAGVDQVGLLPENRPINTKPPTSGS